MNDEMSMNAEIILASAPDVEAAFLSDALVPAPPPSSLGPGPMADLRQAMARFSGPSEHPSRRARVDALAASVDGFAFAGEAHRRTTEFLVAGVANAATELGFVVPVDTMAAALGVVDQEISAVRLDVAMVAAVIGRQDPSTPETDAAATRLLNRFGTGGDSIAAVSLLYQTHDATAALFAATLAAHETGCARQPAVARTVRVAVTATTVRGHEVPAGRTVTLDLAQSGFEFGAGPHRCPGRSIAERIVAGMINALTPRV